MVGVKLALIVLCSTYSGGGHIGVICVSSSFIANDGELLTSVCKKDVAKNKFIENMAVKRLRSRRGYSTETHGRAMFLEMDTKYM